MENSSERPETGPMRFENDWCGVFIRGDNCFYYKLCLERLVEFLADTEDKPSHFITDSCLKDLINILSSSDERIIKKEKTEKNIQKMKGYRDCIQKL